MSSSEHTPTKDDFIDLTKDDDVSSPVPRSPHPQAKERVKGIPFDSNNLEGQTQPAANAVLSVAPSAEVQRLQQDLADTSKAFDQVQKKNQEMSTKIKSLERKVIELGDGLREARSDAEGLRAMADAVQQEAEEKVKKVEEDAKNAIDRTKNKGIELIEKARAETQEAKRLLGIEKSAKKAAIARAATAETDAKKTKELVSEQQVELDAAAECVEVAQKETEEAKKLARDRKNRLAMVVQQCDILSREEIARRKAAEKRLQEKEEEISKAHLLVAENEKLVLERESYERRLSRRDTDIEDLKKKVAAQKERADRKEAWALEQDRFLKREKALVNDLRAKLKRYEAAASANLPRTEGAPNKQFASNLNRQGRPDGDLTPERFHDVEKRRNPSPENREVHVSKAAAGQREPIEWVPPPAPADGDVDLRKITQREIEDMRRKRLHRDAGMSAVPTEGAGEPQAKRYHRR